MTSPHGLQSSRISHSSSLPSRLYTSHHPSHAGPSSPTHTHASHRNHAQTASHLARTPTPTQHSSSESRRRQNSHLRSSIFDPSPRMHPLAPLPPLHSNTPNVEGEVFHRDHSLISFEWQIQGLEWLKRSLEEVPINDWTVDYEVQNPEILPELIRRGVVIGEGWYKLDLARTIPPPHTPNTPIEEIAAAITKAASDAVQAGEQPEVPPTSLSLYITSPTLENSPLTYSFSSAIFVGLRPSQPNVGCKYSHTRWIWYTNMTHEFTKESEYASINLPPLEDLMEMDQMKVDDGFTLCVQIGSPAETLPAFVLPEEVKAPISLIRGLEGLLDSHTGDVQFVCLEHVMDRSGDTDDPPLVSRKRVLYAHSEILKARSEYFKSLLEGGFKEADTAKGRVTVVVDDAGFETVYWMLHFLYTNELHFAASEDVRLIMDQQQLDRRELKRVLCGRAGAMHHHHLWTTPGEWDYRAIPRDGDVEHDGLSTSFSLSMSELDGRSEISGKAKSVSDAGTRKSSASRGVVPSSPPGAGSKDANRDAGETSTVGPPGRLPVAMVSSVTSRRLSSNAAASGAAPSSSTPTRPNRPISATTPTPAQPQSHTKKTNPLPISGSSTTSQLTSPPLQPRGPGGTTHHRALRLSDVQPQPDPHPHPTPRPTPASPLATYMLAHRYRLDVLEGLAKERILKGLTVENCMPMLYVIVAHVGPQWAKQPSFASLTRIRLATHAYDDLHAEILDFVVECFGMVQISAEFLSCIKEVSSGVWGDTGGDVLVGIFRRL